MKKEHDTARSWPHSGMGSVNDKLVINFRNISHTMRALYEGRGSQRHILIVLLDTGRITQRALTERLRIKPGSASEVIGKLQNAGLIAREPSAEDRRTIDIVLTDEGVKRAGEARAQRDKRHEQMFSCLTDEEKEQLLELLEKVNADWEARYPDAAQPDCREKHSHARGAHPPKQGEWIK